MQTQKRDLSAGQNFIAPVLRQKQSSIEETISVNSNSDASPSSLRNANVCTIQESPKLYQNYGKESHA